MVDDCVSWRICADSIADTKALDTEYPAKFDALFAQQQAILSFRDPNDMAAHEVEEMQQERMKTRTLYLCVRSQIPLPFKGLLLTSKPLKATPTEIQKTKLSSNTPYPQHQKKLCTTQSTKALGTFVQWRLDQYIAPQVHSNCNYHL